MGMYFQVWYYKSGMKEFICPHCESYFKLTDNSSRCPFCGKEIEDVSLTGLNIDRNLYDLIESGFIMLQKEDFDSVKQLGDKLIKEYPHCFWGYCFISIGEIKIDITQSINDVSYQLNDLEIQEDLKTRIYHKARNKYYKCTTSTYEAICDHYPDVPLERRGEWKKCPSNYDKKLESIKEKLKLFILVKDKYLSNMEIYSISEKEMAIVHNFRLWGELLEHGLNELTRYNKKANELVDSDYKKTPNPGNKVHFLFYNLLLVASFVILLLSIGGEILSNFIRNDIFFIIDLSFNSITSILFITICVFTSIKTKLFSKGHVFLGSLLVLLSTIISTLNIFFVFHDSFFKYIFDGIMVISGLISLIFSIYKMNYYLPRNTYVNGTYIGNYKALVTNSFKVEFSFEWKVFTKGQEQELGAISEYLTPYIC